MPDAKTAPNDPVAPSARRRIAGLVAVAVALASACGGGVSSDPVTSDGAAVCTGHRTARVQEWIEPMEPAPIPQLPVTVTDHLDQEVTIDDASRILALDRYGTLASTVYALGLGDNLVGRDTSTLIPDLDDLPVVTQGGHNISAEAVLDLRPSVVLTDLSIGPIEVQQQLIDSGVPVVFMDDARSVDTIDDQIRAVAEVLGVPDRGEELAERVVAEVDEAKAELARLVAERDGDPIRMVFLYLRGTSGIFYWFGEGSGADDLIASLGGVDVAKEVDVDGYTPINAEGLIKASPDMFLIMTGGLESVGGVDGLAEIPGVAETPAGINECVVDMADGQILGFGPQYPSTLRAMARAVYGSGSVEADS